MNEEVTRLIHRHNELAKLAKVPPLEVWDHDVESLRQKVVALRGKVRSGSLADAAAKLLCHVHFEERADRPKGEANKYKKGSLPKSTPHRTVGFSYREIERRLRGRFPESLVTEGTLRWYATKIRRRTQERFVGKTLPDRRPSQP
jgi:hypothetical protein